MISRRTMISSAASLGAVALTGCGPAAVQTATAVATVASPVARVTAAALNIAYALTFMKGLITKTNVGPAMAGIDAVTRAAQGVEVLTQQNGKPSRPHQGDSLLPITTANTQIENVILFQQPPVLPGSDKPETAYWLMPVVLDGSGRALIKGDRRLIPLEELLGPQTLFAPGYQQLELAGPGVYQLGYELASEHDERTQVGGGPFLHVFDDAAWKYDELLATGGFDPRPDSTWPEIYPIDPADQTPFNIRYS